MNRDDVGEAIDHRVPEAAELADLAELDGDLAVDEVEDVGDDHDYAGGDETIVRQLVGGQRVDHDADEGEDVGMDPERHARGDDGAKRKHADAADESGEGHVTGIMNGSDIR